LSVHWYWICVENAPDKMNSKKWGKYDLRHSCQVCLRLQYTHTSFLPSFKALQKCDIITKQRLYTVCYYSINIFFLKYFNTNWKTDVESGNVGEREF